MAYSDGQIEIRRYKAGKKKQMKKSSSRKHRYFNKNIESFSLDKKYHGYQ